LIDNIERVVELFKITSSTVNRF